MIKLNATEKTPAIMFDTQAGHFSITGKSLTDNAYEFYQPLLEKIEEYKKQPQLQTIIDIHLDYFNTSSSKAMLDLLLTFETIKESSKVMVNWYYEKDDEDMLEAGEGYKEIVDLPFKMIELN